MGSVRKALSAESAEEVADAMAEDGTSLLFEQCLRPALFGHWTEVRLLVETWHDGVLALLHSADATQDVKIEGGMPLVKTLGGEFDGRVVEAMDSRVTDLVTSPWLSRFGDGLGASVTMVDVVRSGLPHGPGPLRRPPGFPELPRGIDLVRFRRLCEVAIRGMQPPLEYLQQTFGLNRTEFAALFGVSRQAFDQWEARGIPVQKLPLIADLTAMAELLDRKLKPGRLPILVRQPSPAYHGKSFLEMIKLGRHRELREGLKRAFDWSTAA